MSDQEEINPPDQDELKIKEIEDTNGDQLDTVVMATQTSARGEDQQPITDTPKQDDEAKEATDVPVEGEEGKVEEKENDENQDEPKPVDNDDVENVLLILITDLKYYSICICFNIIYIIKNYYNYFL